MADITLSLDMLDLLSTDSNIAALNLLNQRYQPASTGLVADFTVLNTFHTDADAVNFFNDSPVGNGSDYMRISLQREQQFKRLFNLSNAQFADLSVVSNIMNNSQFGGSLFTGAKGETELTAQNKGLLVNDYMQRVLQSATSANNSYPFVFHAEGGPQTFSFDPVAPTRPNFFKRIAHAISKSFFAEEFTAYERAVATFRTASDNIANTTSQIVAANASNLSLAVPSQNFPDLNNAVNRMVSIQAPSAAVDGSQYFDSYSARGVALNNASLNILNDARTAQFAQYESRLNLRGLAINNGGLNLARVALMAGDYISPVQQAQGAVRVNMPYEESLGNSARSNQLKTNAGNRLMNLLNNPTSMDSIPRIIAEAAPMINQVQFQPTTNNAEILAEMSAKRPILNSLASIATFALANQNNPVVSAQINALSPEMQTSFNNIVQMGQNLLGLNEIVNGTLNAVTSQNFRNNGTNTIEGRLLMGNLDVLGEVGNIINGKTLGELNTPTAEQVTRSTELIQDITSHRTPTSRSTAQLFEFQNSLTSEINSGVNQNRVSVNVNENAPHTEQRQRQAQQQNQQRIQQAMRR